MRRRYSTGYLRKQRGRWIGSWYADGVRKSKSLGLISEVSKGDASDKLTDLIRAGKAETDETKFGPFVRGPYLTFFSRKWKESTRSKNVNRVQVHLVRELEERDLRSFRRDELQDFLDRKAAKLSGAMVTHLRWDLKQIFDLAIAEGKVELNPALMLFTPRNATRIPRRTMTASEVSRVCSVLADRERLIAKLAIFGGMRPGEIFALSWVDVGQSFVEVRQRVYEGVLDSPKSEKGYRKVALPACLKSELERYRSTAVSAESFVFPSEVGTPMSKHNVWCRNIQPKLKAVGLEWCNFQVMRRTHATLMKELNADPKLVADQMGHTLDVNQNVYTQSSVEVRLPLVNALEQAVLR